MPMVHEIGRETRTRINLNENQASSIPYCNVRPAGAVKGSPISYLYFIVTNTKRSLLISACAMVMACCFAMLSEAWETSSQKQNVIALSGSVERNGETNVMLRLKLTNTGANTLSIPFGHLPWHRYAMSIALVETDPYSTPIKQRAVIADPLPAEPHRIIKGETLEGVIDLADRFPGVSEKLNRGDIVVFWSYQCPVEGFSIERVSGSLVISQTKH
jgi:hypothetical protein